jgi:hypothetical protein
MSAWIVSRAHIDALVLAGVQWGVIADPDPDKLAGVGRMLWAQCLASVAYRYPRDGDGDRPGPTDFRDADVTTYTAPTAEVLLSAAGVVKAIGCYEYQSCEHPGWQDPDNPARGYSEALRRAVMATVTTTYTVANWSGRPPTVLPAGYQQAPWGVDDLAQLAAAAPADSRGRG